MPTTARVADPPVPAPVPDADEARDNATFAALLAALSRPGCVQRLPEPGAAPIARALLDGACRAHAEDAALRAVIRRAGAALDALRGARAAS